MACRSVEEKNAYVRDVENTCLNRGLAAGESYNTDPRHFVDPIGRLLKDIDHCTLLQDEFVKDACLNRAFRAYLPLTLAREFAEIKLWAYSLGRYNSKDMCHELGVKAAEKMGCAFYGIGADEESDWTVITYDNHILSEVAKDDPILVGAVEFYTDTTRDFLWEYSASRIRNNAVLKLSPQEALNVNESYNEDVPSCNPVL